jgi:hypothetical protein
MEVHRIIHQVCRNDSPFESEDPRWSEAETQGHAELFHKLLGLFSEYYTVVSSIQEQVLLELYKKQKIMEAAEVGQEIMKYEIPMELKVLYSSCEAAEFEAERHNGKKYKDLYLEERDRFQEMQERFQQKVNEVKDGQQPAREKEVFAKNRSRIKSYFKAGDRPPKQEAEILAEQLKNMMERNWVEDMEDELRIHTQSVQEKVITVYHDLKSIHPEERCNDDQVGVNGAAGKGQRLPPGSPGSKWQVMNNHLKIKLDNLEEVLLHQDEITKTEFSLVELSQLLDSAAKVAESIETMLTGVQFFDQETIFSTELVDRCDGLKVQAHQEISKQQAYIKKMNEEEKSQNDQVSRALPKYPFKTWNGKKSSSVPLWRIGSH